MGTSMAIASAEAIAVRGVSKHDTTRDARVAALDRISFDEINPFDPGQVAAEARAYTPSR
jgi:hypothetical protein